MYNKAIVREYVGMERNVRRQTGKKGTSRERNRERPLPIGSYYRG